MGATTYIGNAPSFLIWAVAKQDGVSIPSFFGFTASSGFIVLPQMVVMTFIFLHISSVWQKKFYLFFLYLLFCATPKNLLDKKCFQMLFFHTSRLKVPMGG